MATEDTARTPSPSIQSLPRLEDLRTSENGYEPDAVRDAFDAYRRHVVQLQAQLRVLKAAGRTADVEPTGHAMRMDALHLIREAAEFADVLERDAQRLAAAGLGEPAISRVVEALLAQAEREAEGETNAPAPPAGGLRAAPEPADTGSDSPAS